MERKKFGGSDNPLSGYRAKTKRESIIKSAIYGACIGFAVSLIVGVISYFTLYNALWIAVAAFAVSGVGFSVLLYFLKFRPTEQSTASRVDGLGLDERVITMIEFEGDDSFIAKKQREDAKLALNKVSPKSMKVSVSIVSVILLAVIAVSSVFTVTYSTIRAENYVPPVAEENYEDEIIKEMLKNLRDIIDNAEVKQSLKDRLHGMVDDLEDRLKPTDSTEVKVAKISETAQIIHDILEREMSKTSIAQELQKRDTTKELGKAIEIGDPNGINKVFEDMYASIQPLKQQQKIDVLMQTGTDIMDSLEAASDTPKDLAKALKDLADAFFNAIEIIKQDGNEKDADDQLKIDMDAAMEAIKDAMKDMQEAEKTDDKLQDEMQGAMDKLLPTVPSEKDPTKPDDKEGEEDEGDKKDDNVSGPATPSDGEIIYDAIIDGKTPYMEVYEKYYEKAMELLTSGTLSEEQRRVIENYFKILS